MAVASRRGHADALGKKRKKNTNKHSVETHTHKTKMAVQETASQLSMALKVQEYPTLKVNNRHRVRPNDHSALVADEGGGWREFLTPGEFDTRLDRISMLAERA